MAAASPISQVFKLSQGKKLFVAKAHTSISATKLQLANSLSLCIGLAFVAQLAPLQMMSSAQAADFSRAKRTFVPPTSIPRRYDSESASTDSDAYSDPGYTTPSVAKTSAGGKYKLVAPPPPVTPSLLPSSLLHMPSQSSSASASASSKPKPTLTTPAPSAQRWSVGVQKNLKRAATSPRVASFIDQAQTKAQALVNDGKLDQAQALLKSYVKQLPRDPQLKDEFAKVSVQRAQQLLTDQNIDAAAKMAREALAVQPTNQAAHTVLSQALKKQGLSAESATDRVKAAKSLQARGRIVDAEQEYNSAQKIKPSAEGYVGLGDIALKSGNKEKAKDNYQKALELAPHSGVALRQMGIIRLGQNDYVGANSDLSRALVVDPNDTVASKHLVDLWQGQVTQNPQSANSHLGLARAHQLSGDLKAAQSEYRKVVEIDPNNTNLPAARQSFKLALARQDAHHAIDAAHNLEAAGALQQAHAKVTEAVALCPGDSSFKLYQAQLGEKLGLNAPSSSSGTGSTAAVAAGGMAAAAAGLLPGLAPPTAPSFRAGMSARQAAFGAAQEQPPAMALDGIPKPAPLDSAAHVDSMSGFLTSLRNYSVQQKQQSQDYEDGQHSALKSYASAPTPSALGSSSDISATSAAANSAIAGADAGLANVNKLLKSINAPSSTAGSSHAEALGSTAAAAASAIGSKFPAASSANSYSGGAYTPDSYSASNPAGFARSLSTDAPESSAFGNSNAQLSPQAAAPRASAYRASKPVAKTSSTSPTTTPAKAKTAAAQPSLTQQNKQLQAQLAAAQAQLKAMKSPGAALQAETPKAAEPLSASPLSAAPLAASLGAAAPEIASYSALPSQASAATAAALSVAPNAGNASVQSILQSLPQSLTSSEGFKNAISNLPNSAAALQSYAANLPPEQASALQAALKPPISTGNPNAPAGAVRLELEGVKPSPMDIKLNVVLHNDQRTALTVPTTAKAIINMKGEPQRVVKVAFPAKTVPPNGEMRGVIKVPGHNLSPTADLYIPDLMPGQGMDRDVHLTVPISFK